ncbi:MAG: NAD(P)/FAD-dependent oxidoreductase [Bacteroidia bacterium]
MNLSFWERDTFFSDMDVVVIGSGIVGLNAALALKKKNKNLRVIVLERGMLPSGASSKNAGFACFGSPSELLDDLKICSEDEVFSLVEKRWKGLQKLRKNLGDKNIDLHNWGGYEIFDSKERFDACKTKLNYLNRQLAPILGKRNVYRDAGKKIKEFGFRNIRHMILNTAESQIDTGKMISALIGKVRAAGVEILNGFEVREINDAGRNVSIISASGIRINSRRLIIATNGFAKQFLPDLPVEPARAQVLITKPISGLRLKGTFHYDSGYYYFRNIGDRVLFGGGRNLDLKKENTAEFGLTPLVQNRLEELLRTTILPGVKYSIDMRWSGIMGVGPEKKSIVEAVSNTIFCAVRMGGMGVAIGTLVGEEVAGIVSESI